MATSVARHSAARKTRGPSNLDQLHFHDKLGLLYLTTKTPPGLMASTLDCNIQTSCSMTKKGKVFPYLLPSVGPGADPGVQAVSPQVT